MLSKSNVAGSFSWTGLKLETIINVHLRIQYMT